MAADGLGDLFCGNALVADGVEARARGAFFERQSIDAHGIEAVYRGPLVKAVADIGGDTFLSGDVDEAGHEAVIAIVMHRWRETYYPCTHTFGSQGKRQIFRRKAWEGTGLARIFFGNDPALNACGGGQEKGYRRGTQDMPSALSFAAALAARPYDMDRMATLRRRLEDGIKAAGGVIIAETALRVPTIGALALPGGTSASMLVQLDLAGIAVSAGSACSSGKAKASHVLAAMDLPADVQSGFLRLSFGPDTDDADIDAFCFAMASCDKPVLAFCKSGMRAASLWALSQAGKRTTEEILREAMACGYDLTPLVPRIEARAKAVRD